MPQIIPIRDLKNTSEISELCHAVGEPIFVTKNGYGDMVVMSMEAYEKRMRMLAEEQIKAGKVRDAEGSTKELRKKYGL